MFFRAKNHNMVLTILSSKILIILQIQLAGEKMELQYSDLQNDIRSIKLIGTLDIVGVGDIETKFTGYCAGEAPRVLVDLSDVDYLASIGIRLFTITAKSISSRGGRMVLLHPVPEVKHILEVTGIPVIIPVLDGFESAETLLLMQ